MSQTPPPQEPPEFSAAAVTWTSFVFYGGIVGLAFALAWLFNVDLSHTSGLARAEVAPDWTKASIDVALGAGMGLVLVAVSYFTRHLSINQKIYADFKRLLGSLSLVPITILAFLSAIAEEILFRGVLQPKFGYVGVALLFGILHGGISKRLSPWVLYATALGFILGGLYEYTETLLAPFVCHFTVNYFNYKFIAGEPVGAKSA